MQIARSFTSHQKRICDFHFTRRMFYVESYLAKPDFRVSCLGAWINALSSTPTHLLNNITPYQLPPRLLIRGNCTEDKYKRADIYHTSALASIYLSIFPVVDEQTRQHHLHAQTSLTTKHHDRSTTLCRLRKNYARCFRTLHYVVMKHAALIALSKVLKSTRVDLRTSTSHLTPHTSHLSHEAVADGAVEGDKVRLCGAEL